MSLEQFNLSWHTYLNHLKEMMQTLMETKKSTDVTLVCDDKVKFKAHKFVLSACSPVFQSIIDDLPENENSFIYLRGVRSQEMNSILQFMYLGQATFYKDRMNEFLHVAKILEVKEISENLYFNNDIEQESEGNNSKKDMNEYDLTRIPIQNLDEIEQIDSKLMSDVSIHQCNKCDKMFSSNANLFRHDRNTHEGIKYPCDVCDYVASQKTNLIRHKNNKHGIF